MWLILFRRFDEPGVHLAGTVLAGAEEGRLARRITVRKTDDVVPEPYEAICQLSFNAEKSPLRFRTRKIRDDENSQRLNGCHDCRNLWKTGHALGKPRTACPA